MRRQPQGTQRIVTPKRPYQAPRRSDPKRQAYFTNEVIQRRGAERNERKKQLETLHWWFDKELMIPFAGPDDIHPRLDLQRATTDEAYAAAAADKAKDPLCHPQLKKNLLYWLKFIDAKKPKKATHKKPIEETQAMRDNQAFLEQVDQASQEQDEQPSEEPLSTRHDEIEEVIF